MDENMIIVIKRNSKGDEVWRYSSALVNKQSNVMVIEAFFNRDDMLFNGILLRRGDRFIETYYNDRWYNIFEIYDHMDGVFKGWYCNVTRPAVFGDNEISYVDLALDLLVYPDGKRLVLDEDEFAVLEIDETTRARAQAALLELKTLPLVQTIDITSPKNGC